MCVHGAVEAKEYKCDGIYVCALKIVFYFVIFTFLCFCTYVCGCLWNSEGTLGPLELELQVIMGLLTWVL